MSVSTQSSAPYATGSSVIGIIRRFRDKGLSAPFTGDVLLRAGVSESLVNRTMHALQTLELIDDKGMPTPTLQKMRVVGESEFKQCLADWIRSAYAEVFQFVDPAKDDAVRVRDAFRSYTPIGQQDRMVSLFLSLCAEAGLVNESKKSETKPAARKPPTQRGSSTTLVSTRIAARNPLQHTNVFSNTGLPPALAGLMQSLPPPGTGWTKEKRDLFVSTFQTVLDFDIPIIKQELNVDIDNEGGVP